MGKKLISYYFADEPQFATTADRQWCANYLRACRNKSNGNAARYLVRRVKTGHITVTLRYRDVPVAVIMTY